MKLPPFMRTSTVKVSNLSGSGMYGSEFDEAREVRVRIEWKTKLLHAPGGDDVMVQATLMFDPSEDVPVGSMVEIDGRNYKVLTAGKPEDLAGPQFLEVTIG